MMPCQTLAAVGAGHGAVCAAQPTSICECVPCALVQMQAEAAATGLPLLLLVPQILPPLPCDVLQRVWRKCWRSGSRSSISMTLAWMPRSRCGSRGVGAPAQVQPGGTVQKTILARHSSSTALSGLGDSLPASTSPSRTQSILRYPTPCPLLRRTAGAQSTRPPAAARAGSSRQRAARRGPGSGRAPACSGSRGWCTGDGAGGAAAVGGSQARALPVPAASKRAGPACGAGGAQESGYCGR